MEKLTFKEIEKKMNDTLSSFSVADSVDASYIKNQILDELKKHFPTINAVDIHANKFCLRFDFEHDYLDFEKYDDGHVDVIFSISTKRTDTLRAVSKTKNKYVHTMKEKPIKFSSAKVFSYVPSFEWVNDDINDIRIRRDNYSHKNNLADSIKGSSVEDILNKVKDTYPSAFRSDVVQPFLKNILFISRKKEAIFNVIPNDLKVAIENKDNDLVFDGIRDFIMSNNLCTI